MNTAQNDFHDRIRCVQALNGVGGVDHHPHILGELEDRADSVPVVIPTPHGPGILLFPFLRDLIQRFPACLLGWRIVNGFQIIGECFPVFIRHIFQRVVYLVDDAALVIGLGIRSSDGSADLGQSVRAQDQDVLYAAVFQFIQHGQPVPGAFIFANLDGQ